MLKKIEKGEMKLMKKFTVFMILIMLATCSFGFTSVNAMTVTDTKITESPTVYSDEEVPHFADFANIITPRWITFGPILAQAEENYQHISFDELQKRYRTGTVIDYPINEEKYGFFGIDDSNVEVRIQPVDSLSAANNITADGDVTFHIRTVSQFPSSDYIYRNNDSRKLKDLYSDIRILNENTTVSYGKILYRTTTGSTWGSWNFVNLNDLLDQSNVTLYFASGLKVQIVIIYEVKELAINIFYPHMYYHVRGIYRFNTQA